MAWTKTQQYTIDSRNESLLVSAAAGSGKTSVLVERVTGLLRGGGDINRMLIVTFTNAAAAEMKERIAKSLGGSIVRHSHISTFHRFAMDIIKQYYYVSGVDPSLSICDEYQQSLLKNAAMDEMFEELFNKDDEDFLDFLNCYASVKSDKGARDLINRFYTFLRSFPEPQSYLNAVSSGDVFDIDKYYAFASELAYDRIKRASVLNKRAVEILNNPERDGAEPMPKLAGKLQEDQVFYDAISESFDKKEYERVFSAIAEFSFTRFAKTNAEKASYAFVEDEIEALRAAVKDEIAAVKALGGITKEKLAAEKAALAKPLGILCRLTQDYSNRYEKKKLAKGVMDFSDIEHRAIDILKNEDVCNELRNSFDFIFVDEYQDSNLIQDELIFKIARPDNVFLVGDVKQSIYKFRLAEPEIFLDKYIKYKSGLVPFAAAVDLNSNFRSKKPVVDFVNKTFSYAMRPETVGIDYDDDAALKEGNPYKGNRLYKPELYLYSQNISDEDTDDEIVDLKLRELEALSVVNIIKKYHGQMIFDAKKNVERPLEYSDMVILLRKVKNCAEFFYQALEDAGIPVYLERGEGYFDTTEIRVLINLLKIIDNFKEDVSLISVLHFPSFGFSSEELSAIRIYSNAKDLKKISFADAFKLYVQEGSDETLKKRCMEFSDKISHWRKKAAYMPLDKFVWELLSESGIATFAAALTSGLQRTANLRAFADKAFEYEQQNGGGLYGFISYIEFISDKNGEVETGQISLLAEGSDCVRIMTIHKSKGLEFPFVLLAGVSDRFQKDKSLAALGLHKDFGASLKIVEPKKALYYLPESLKLIGLKKRREEMAELIRVLYVAMTRAKDILVFSGAVKDYTKYLKKNPDLLRENTSNASSYLDMILPAFEAENIHVVSAADLSLSAADDSYEKVIKALDEGFVLDESALPFPAEEIRARLDFDYSGGMDFLHKEKYSVTEIAALAREKKKEKNYSPGYHRQPAFISEAPLDPAARGTAYHNVMEHIPFTSEGKSPKEIAAFIQGLAEKHIITASEALVVDPGKISAFFKSDIGKRAIAAKEIYKEAPFVLSTVYGGRDVYVQGTIDCFFKEGDSYVLLDYKSNYIDGSSPESEKQRLKDEYIPQLELYRQALEKIKGCPVKEAVLYLFGINDIIRI